MTTKVGISIIILYFNVPLNSSADTKESLQLRHTNRKSIKEGKYALSNLKIKRKENYAHLIPAQ